MSLQQLSKEDLKEMSLIELAYQLMEEKKQAYAFSDLVDELAGLLELSKDEIRSRMVQFYTDINIDGRFLSLGENRWGLRIWYPYDQIDEEIAPAVKSKKKKAKKVYEEDEDLELLDDDLDYDDLDDFEDDDLIDDEDEEDEEDDFVDLDEEDEAFEEDDELISEDEYDLDVDDDDDMDEEEEEEELEEEDEK
ncbi:DNA-directed RNA polymerase subunit delta [Heyndrickxia camelliae]|uniref:Probable DNA-directed RNA polymerase subunit delta n=1 Tax=Heyndrickxia camelliae TaxID=1707093 RepID=A0A2N3LJA2_9BACI|nr:DNA-directed RNA polymerase subunit delta [Heyndrickxia camelliae]PKR84711.1 DNA-directed RNA polymerase subunit delta [Heyndrickxia camelliae]